MRWMDLESVIQSEVIQKKKNKYHTLCTYMESKKKKNGTDEHSGRNKKVDIENGLKDMGWEGEAGAK